MDSSVASRIRRRREFALVAIIVVCIVPRNQGNDFGWPLAWFDARPFLPGAFVTESEFRDSMEQGWRQGEFGPNFAPQTDPYRGWHYLRLGHGLVVTVNILALPVNIAVAVVLGIGFSAAEARLQRRYDRRYWPGHCRQCGYDLTANESGVCPECGHPV